MSTLDVPRSNTQATQWEIAGLQHEIFLRIFPSLRHEIISPVSVSRMGLSVLKRSLQKSEMSSETVQQHLAKIDEQMQLSVIGIRALKMWDSDSNAMASAAEIITMGVKLMSYRLSMRNIHLDYQDGKEIAGEVLQQPLLYCWLGILCCLEDMPFDGQLVHLHLRNSSSHSVAIDIIRTGTQPSLESTIPANHPTIQQQDIMRLVPYHGNVMRASANALSLQW